MDGNWQDSSGSGYHGVPSGDATITSSTKIGSGAGQFDGASDYINIPQQVISTGDTEWTACAWFKAPQGASRRFLFETTGVNGYAVSLALQTDGALESFSRFTNNQTPSCKTTKRYDDNQWHFSCAYLDGDRVGVFVDGENKTCASFPAAGVIASTGFNIGAVNRVSLDFSFFEGHIDEIAIWSRALHQDEITQLYRRGANRLKVQTRTCADSTCSADEEWQGPDNANGEFYFSELNNCTVRNADGTCDLAAGLIQAINPEYTLSNFTNYVLAPKQYFQYRVLMESDDESGTPTFPSLTSINFGTKYFGGKPTVVTKTGHAFTSLSDFSVTISGTCTPKFQLGLGLTDWYYWNGSNWVAAVDTPADVLEANTETDISANISSFVADQGSGSLYIRAFLESDSDQACNLEEISIIE